MLSSSRRDTYGSDTRFAPSHPYTSHRRHSCDPALLLYRVCGSQAGAGAGLLAHRHHHTPAEHDFSRGCFTGSVPYGDAGTATAERDPNLDGDPIALPDQDCDPHLDLYAAAERHFHIAAFADAHFHLDTAAPQRHPAAANAHQ